MAYALPWQDYMQPQENILSSLVRGIPSLAYSFQGKNLKPQKNLADQIQGLAHAQYDQNDPLFQQIYGDERGAIQQDLAGAIAELVRQNRKQNTLGRTPLFNPERGGEQVFRQLTQGYTGAQENARNRAREIIGVGQSGLANAYGAQNLLSTQQQENKKSKASGFSGIADMLPALLKLF